LLNFFLFVTESDEFSELTNYDDETIKAWFDKAVDQVYNDENLLKKIIEFLLNYALHAAPKDETYSSVKAGQLAFYDEDPAKEIANGFPCFFEYMTQTDMSWCTWQFYNSYPDWLAKKNAGLTGRHTLKARFTGDKHCRRQPEEDSEGMKLYHTMTKWYEEFKTHDDFVTKARPLCNQIAKEKNSSQLGLLKVARRNLSRSVLILVLMLKHLSWIYLILTKELIICVFRMR
jgi:hypothetical protein